MSMEEVVQRMRKFTEVLMKNDRELFEKMLADLNLEALEGLGLGKEAFELVAMTLMFQQQKMIAWLLDSIERMDH